MPSAQILGHRHASNRNVCDGRGFHDLGLGSPLDLMDGGDAIRRITRAGTLSRLNDALLDVPGGTWDHPPTLDARWESRAEITATMETVSDAVADCPSPGPVVWDHPRTTLLLPHLAPPLIADRRRHLDVGIRRCRRPIIERTRLDAQRGSPCSVAPLQRGGPEQRAGVSPSRCRVRPGGRRPDRDVRQGGRQALQGHFGFTTDANGTPRPRARSLLPYTIGDGRALPVACGVLLQRQAGDERLQRMVSTGGF